MDEFGHKIRRIASVLNVEEIRWDSSSSLIKVTSDVSSPSESGRDAVYDIRGNLRSVKLRAEKEHEVTSPDGKYSYNIDTGKITLRATGGVLGILPPDYVATSWDKYNNLLGLIDDDAKGNVFYEFDTTKKQLESHVLKFDASSSAGKAEFDGFMWLKIDRIASRPHDLLAYSYWGHGDYGLAILDMSRWTLHYITDSPVVAWSPDGSRFCGRKPSNTGNYSRRPDGSWRQVWVSPLEIVGVPSGKVRIIQQGLVSASGADWRGGSQSSSIFP
jgi:hypothetical protein